MAKSPAYILENTVIEISAQADQFRRTAIILRPNLPLQVQTAPSLGKLANGRVMLGIRHGYPTVRPSRWSRFPVARI